MCHRCFAPRKRYLDTADFEAKTMRKVRQRVEIAAAGGYLKGCRNSTRVVKWDADGRNVRAGPGIIAIIVITCIITIIYIMFLITLSAVLTKQECCIMSLNEKRPVPTCSSTRSG